MEAERIAGKSKTLRRLAELFNHQDETNDLAPETLAEIDAGASNLAWRLPNQDFENVKYWGEATVAIPQILTTALLIDGTIVAPVKFMVLVRRARPNPKTKISASINIFRVSLTTMRERDIVAVVSGEMMPRRSFNYVVRGREALPIFEGLIALGEEIVAHVPKD